MNSNYIVLVDENGTPYLAHHGIKGQKWGVRRFQNPDGTLTDAGQKRYYGKAEKIQRDIDSFKGLEKGIYTDKGKMLLSSDDVKNSVNALKDKKDKAVAKGDKRRARDAEKLNKPTYKEKLAAQNYQKWSKNNIPGLSIGKHFVDNAKWWKSTMKDIKGMEHGKVEAYCNAILDQPLHVTGFTGTSDTTLRKRLKGEFTEWY